MEVSSEELKEAKEKGYLPWICCYCGQAMIKPHPYVEGLNDCCYCGARYGTDFMQERLMKKFEEDPDSQID